MANKMTYKEAINVALGIMGDNAEYAEAAEKLNALIGQLDKRNASGNGKPTKAQRDNAEKAERVYELILGSAEGMTPTEVGVAIGENVQKATALLGALVKAGRAVKEKNGKKMVYKAVEVAVVEAVDVDEGE